MNPNLSHLPANIRKDLNEIVEVIKDVAKPEKIILFGSFARGDWVDDAYVERGAVFTYKSDMDFLVVLQDVDVKDYEIKSRIVNRTKKYEHPVRPMVRSIGYINYGLERGQYFFTDIIKDGLVLFDTGQFEFAEPRQLTIEEQREQAVEYYEKWVESGTRSLFLTKTAYESALQKGFELNEIMFWTHQVAEYLYAGFGLVFTGYKPKTHSIEEYREYTKSISDDVNKLFCYPPNDEEEDRLFKILQKSYIDARYQFGYHIERADLEKILTKVERLEQLVVQLCKERIESLR